MRQQWRVILEDGKHLSEEFTRTRASLAAGGLAYFTALSLAPAALALGILAGIFVEPEDVSAAVERLSTRAPDTFESLEPITDSLLWAMESASGSSFTIATIVSLLIAIYAASKMVLGLRTAMNAAFGVVDSRGGLLQRAFAAIVTLIALSGGVAMVVLLTLLPRLLDWLGLAPIPATTGSPILDWALAVAVVFLVVRWVLEHGPDREGHVPWNSLGAWAATLGIAGATIGVGVYAHFSTVIGAAILIFGTAIVILLWLYLCFVAFLWGAVIEAWASSRREPPGRAGDDSGQEAGDAGREAHVQSVGPRSEHAEDEGADSGDSGRDDGESKATAAGSA
ncbi:MAG: YihY/virulence factor BrkB family protein [Candidatus Nanopelagicales bacterium]|nr:YihY/virulence factor BrkB family protein [Candidatus Nanopelagicales bacterium]MCF8537753.1 YihY/virulence factor BrkB family protein [Candidatus Nanopelagicales bacterium]MCF8543043.1 YihY/virulence factor BrkB family protein [Candidatus Nanopelagicales bacterium]